MVINLPYGLKRIVAAILVLLKIFLSKSRPNFNAVHRFNKGRDETRKALKYLHTLRVVL